MNDKLIEFFGWKRVNSVMQFNEMFDLYIIPAFPEEYPVYVFIGPIDHSGDTPDDSYYTLDFMYPSEIEMFLKNNPEVLK